EVDVEDDPAAGMLTPPPVVAPVAGGASAPAPAPLDPELAAELEEVDFYLEQSLFDEARSLLRDLEARYPMHPLVAEKAAAVERRDLGEAPSPPAGAAPREPPVRGS